MLLLGQPVVTVIWGVVIFGERLSLVQWAGSAIVLAGVGTLSVSGRQSSVVSRQSQSSASVFSPNRLTTYDWMTGDW